MYSMQQTLEHFVADYAKLPLIKYLLQDNIFSATS